MHYRIMRLVIIVLILPTLINSTEINKNWDKFRGLDGNGIIDDDDWKSEKLSNELNIKWTKKLAAVILHRL